MSKDKEKPLTKKDLAEFTEVTLLPAVEVIVDRKIDEKVPPMINSVVNNAKLEIMDHLDIKIADLRGDIILLLRKDDRRFLQLVDILYKKKYIDEDDIKTMDDLRLFPKVSR